MKQENILYEVLTLKKWEIGAIERRLDVAIPLVVSGAGLIFPGDYSRFNGDRSFRPLNIFGVKIISAEGKDIPRLSSEDGDWFSLQSICANEDFVVIFIQVRLLRNKEKHDVQDISEEIAIDTELIERFLTC